MSDVKLTIAELSSTDCTFEGLVLQMEGSNARIKVKNPAYYLQHAFKYRGFSRATPETLVPLIFDKMDDVIISNVVSCMGGEDPLRAIELTSRRDKCALVMKQEYAAIQEALNCTSDFSAASMKEYIRLMEQGSVSPVFTRWKAAFLHLHRDPNVTLDEIYHTQFIKTMKYLFPPRDLGLSATHAATACSITLDTVLPVHTYTEPNDGLGTKGTSSEPYKCYCGQNMRVERLKWDIIRYRTCHCGEKYGLLHYRSGTFLLVCRDAHCLCTHEVHQATRQPLGVPASELAKNYRLHVHELIDASKKSKTECYRAIEEITGRTGRDAHMALMGSTECIAVIRAFCREREIQLQDVLLD